VGGVLISGTISHFSREAKKKAVLGYYYYLAEGVVRCLVFCQLLVAFDVFKVSVHLVLRFEFQRRHCSTLMERGEMNFVGQ